MKTVKTIKQGTVTYTINQLGNRSYRIDYSSAIPHKINHVDKIFATEAECEEYIKSCLSMDKYFERS